MSGHPRTSMYAARAQQTIIMSHKQMTLDLLQSVENDTHQNQKRRATKELGKLLLHIEQTSKASMREPGSVI